MASSSSSSYHPHLNCSKTQMCLFKILHTISSIPPSKEEPSHRGVGIDLNQGLFSIEQSTEEPEPEPEPTAETDQGDISNDKGREEEEKAEEGHRENREKSVESVQVQSFEVDNNGVVQSESEAKSGGGETAPLQWRGQQEGNSLDMLIEAARVLSEEEEGRRLGGELRASQGASEEEDEGRVKNKKQKERWVVVDLYDDVSEDRSEPVVRTKRGRSQALPHRFRDSVVEPLKRASRRQRTVVKRYRE